MRRIFALASVLGFLSLQLACSGAAPPPAKPPLVDPETRLGPVRRPAKHEPPPVMAPPPAYGNKIVMAERGGPASF